MFLNIILKINRNKNNIEDNAYFNKNKITITPRKWFKNENDNKNKISDL